MRSSPVWMAGNPPSSPNFLVSSMKQRPLLCLGVWFTVRSHFPHCNSLLFLGTPIFVGGMPGGLFV